MTPWFSRFFSASQTPARRRRIWARGPQPAWVEILENRVLLSAANIFAQPLATLPGTPFEDVPVQFQFTQGQATVAEIGVFQFDANGTVDGLAPGSEGFEEAVLNSSTRQVLFTQGTPLGSLASGTFVGGRQLGVYFRQDGMTTAGQYDVALTSPNGARAGFDEVPPIWAAVSNVPGANIRQFDDAAVQATFGTPVRFPVPTIDPVAEQTVAEGENLQITISAQNPAGPQSDLRYSLDTPFAGLTIDAMTGVLNWTPTEAQGPGRYDIIVRVSNATRPDSFSTLRIVVNVTEVNVAPVITPIGALEVNQLEELSFTVSATDADRPIFPGQRFLFSLEDAGIDGASIDPETGLFTWTPTLDDVPGTYVFTVRVVDTGTPALEDTETFTVRVDPAVSQ